MRVFVMQPNMHTYLLQHAQLHLVHHDRGVRLLASLLERLLRGPKVIYDLVLLCGPFLDVRDELVERGFTFVELAGNSESLGVGRIELHGQQEALLELFSRLVLSSSH
jgi:hypothetical protein